MKKLTVRLNFSPQHSITVGTLAEQDRRTYFEYAPAFIETGLELSPFKLPLQQGLFEHRDHRFGPLPGLFDDSLPDGWGLLLMDRYFRRQGVDPAALSSIDRLAFLGRRTMGALTYHPAHEMEHDRQPLDLYELGRNAEAVLAGDIAEVLPQLLRAGGSPGGARPKVLVGLREDQIISGEDDLPDGFEHWLVKFAAKTDAASAGVIEYAYALMARKAGIDMPEVRLLEIRKGLSPRRYFAAKRFDRQPGNRRTHSHTFGNLIHAPFRIPGTDYADLLKATRILTRNHRDVVESFRRMVFNIASHNRDDHAKNFAFLMSAEGEWSLSPAYDMTYSMGPGGEHTMTVQGEGMNPTREHCTALAQPFGIKPREAASIIDAVNAAITSWSKLAEKAGMAKSVSKKIGTAMRPL